MGVAWHLGLGLLGLGLGGVLLDWGREHDAKNTLVSHKRNRPGKWEWVQRLIARMYVPFCMFGVLRWMEDPLRSAPSAMALSIPLYPHPCLSLLCPELCSKCLMPSFAPVPFPTSSPNLCLWAWLCLFLSLQLFPSGWTETSSLGPFCLFLCPAFAPLPCSPSLLAGWLVLDAASLFLPRMPPSPSR